MSCKKEQFSYSFFILLTQCHELPAPKLTNFHIFITPPPFTTTLFSKSPYLTAYHKNDGRGWTGRFSEKTSASRTIAANVESSVAIGGFLGGVSGFRWQTNFTKNSILGVTGVLNSPMEYYNKFGNLCNWWNHQIN